MMMNDWMSETLRQAEEFERKRLPVGRRQQDVDEDQTQNLRQQLEKLVKVLEEKLAASSDNLESSMINLSISSSKGAVRRSNRVTCQNVLIQYAKAKLSAVMIICDNGMDEDGIIETAIHNMKNYPEAIIPYMLTLNTFGSLNWKYCEMAKETFLKAENAYTDFKKNKELNGNFSSSSPLLISEMFAIIDGIDFYVNVDEGWQEMERIYADILMGVSDSCYRTHEKSRSSAYCQKALSMQLKHGQYDEYDWARNAARMSGLFITMEQYPTALHCLASAMKVFENVPKSDATWNEKRIVLAEYWVIYAIAYLDYSWSIKNERRETYTPAIEYFDNVRPEFDLDTKEYRKWMPCHPQLYVQMRGLISKALELVINAKLYYPFEKFWEEHMRWTDLHAQLYRCMSWYQKDPAKKANQLSVATNAYEIIAAKLWDNNDFYTAHIDRNRKLLFKIAWKHYENCKSMASVRSAKEVFNFAKKMYKYCIQFLDSYGSVDPEILSDPIRLMVLPMLDLYETIKIICILGELCSGVYPPGLLMHQLMSGD